MIECNINKIAKSYGTDQIFENISFDIKTGERIGLIGPNGSGKTTIIKILFGIENIQEGTFSFRKGSKLGYLDQIPVFDDDVIVIDILKKAFQSLYELKKEIDDLAHSFGHLENVELENALKEYTRLTEIFERKDGYNIDTKIDIVATGLKIDEEMQKMPFNLLSGGEKTRVMLAKILLEKPSLLMLDEPSNHLDLESIEWLENYLKTYEGSVLVVSHDRYFLDNVCEKIVELSSYKAHVYHGNYSYYVIEKERRFLLELKAYLAQEKQIKRMEEQIKRYRIWGVMRDSDKMFKRAKELERRLSKIERLDKPKHGNDKMKIHNTLVKRSGKRVLEAYHINKNFDDLVLLNDAEVEIIYQDRLAILGANGAGKTTLIKLLLEDFNKEESTFKWGTKLGIGYLPQEIHFENEDATVLEYFMGTHLVSQNEARNELAKALFIRDDVHKKIKVLSGGEKSKLKLASMMFEETNLLILDEPTNHLDIDSREVLEELLLDFNGTILFISHDRYFIKKIATRIGEIKQQRIVYYEGDYDYYKNNRIKEVENPKKVAEKVVHSKPKKKSNDKEIFKQIETIEEELIKIKEEMEKNVFDPEKLNELYQKQETLEKQYEALIEQID